MRHNITVHLEHAEGVFKLWSRHRSRGQADRSFRECARTWTGDRVILIDLTTETRMQCERDGTIMGPFKAPLRADVTVVWYDQKPAT
jgi:hypothetical protein